MQAYYDDGQTNQAIMTAYGIYPQYNLFLVKERLHFSWRFYSVLASKWCILRLKDTVFITFMEADVCST